MQRITNSLRQGFTPIKLAVCSYSAKSNVLLKASGPSGAWRLPSGLRSQRLSGVGVVFQPSMSLTTSIESRQYFLQREFTLVRCKLLVFGSDFEYQHIIPGVPAPSVKQQREVQINVELRFRRLHHTKKVLGSYCMEVMQSTICIISKFNSLVSIVCLFIPIT